MNTPFKPVSLSLVDILGEAYIAAVCEARAWLSGEDAASLRALADAQVAFFPSSWYAGLLGQLDKVGTVVCRSWTGSAAGATSKTFAEHSSPALAPLSGRGFYRIGENGRLCFTLKSEHYHIPLGHGFPGYTLVDVLRRLGVPNATHNNTRGHVTRRLEEELVRVAAGIKPGDAAGCAALAASEAPDVLNRVLNLETGSLAAEAALKIALSRFYQTQGDSPAPPYAGRTPVILVMGDDEGAVRGNYHGTTVLTQVMRGMWGALGAALEREGAFRVHALRPNRASDLEAAFAALDSGQTKIAAMFHEFVMMNYGARVLEKEYVQRLYSLCAQHDVLTVADEIQTGVWSPELFIFREYGVRPSMVAVGKGFPGGEYPASRLLFSAAFDRLPQFGALVTNGQEELASLSYLITMRWAEVNATVTRAVGDYYEERLGDLAAKYSRVVAGVEGRRHLGALRFHDLEPAKGFVERLTHAGLDISVQSYKSSCPPTPLTKLPIIAGYEVVDWVIAKMDDALAAC